MKKIIFLAMFVTINVQAGMYDEPAVDSYGNHLTDTMGNKVYVDPILGTVDHDGWTVKRDDLTYDNGAAVHEDTTIYGHDSTTPVFGFGK